MPSLLGGLVVCPSPAQQTRPTPLSLAFVSIFIYLLGGDSLVLGTESQVSQADFKLAIYS